MIIISSTEFKKKYRKSSGKLRSKIAERLGSFEKDQTDPILNCHPLHGEYRGCKSMDITGDIRLIYREVRENVFQLVRFGTHSELYGK